MKTLSLIAASLLLATPAAFAADLVNRDPVAHEVELDDGNKVSTVTIEAGATLKDVCDECVLTIGTSSMDTEDTQVVTILSSHLHDNTVRTEDD